MLHIVTSPRVYSTLKKEIEDGIADQKISSPIANQEALGLPYLQVSFMRLTRFSMLTRDRLSYGKVFESTLRSLAY